MARQHLILMAALACCLLCSPAALARQTPAAKGGNKPAPTVCGFMLESPGGKAPCKACREGWYTPKAGDACVQCKNGIVKVDAATSTATCALCPAGSVFEKRGQSGSCKCPAGSQSTGADAVFGVASCSLCPAGTANPKATTATDACKACTENKIAPAVGSDKCTPCKGNSTANAAATACECAAGSYLFTKTVGSRDTLVMECRACANNTIAAAVNTAAECTPCPINTATTDGITCSTCLPGFWNAATSGTAVCTSCAAGFFQSADGVCSACDAGLTSPENNTWGACCVAGSNWDGSACVAP